MLRKGLIGLSLMAAWAFGPAACGQCEYTLLHTLPNGPSCGTFTYVGTIQALADDGSVCGYARAGSFCPEWPFFWSPGDATLTMLTLPPGMVTGRALDLNEAHDIVGYCRPTTDGSSVPCIWIAGVPTLLPIPKGLTWGEASAINGAGVAVGFWQDAVAGVTHAAKWTSRQFEDIHPRGAWLVSAADDINAAGRIVGSVGSGLYVSTRGAIWDGSVVTELPPIPGGVTSECVAINDSGDILANGSLTHPSDPEFARRSFVWRGGSIASCGFIPGLRDCILREINNAGMAVGDCLPGASATGVVWRGNTLTVALSSGVAVPPNFWAINNSGWIASARKVYEPKARPPADIDQNCFVNVTDLLRVISDWGMKVSPADCTLDGIVNHDDLFEVIMHWGQ